MKWSWRLGRIFGIGVYLHWTFLLLLAGIGFANLYQSGDAVKAAAGIATILLLFGIVLLHELGHSLMARYFGIGTKDITLLPIGGLARLERMPEDPKQEFFVAIAGPAVNVVLAIVCFALLLLQGPADESMHLPKLVGGDLLPWLTMVNVSLVVFNMLPAFPMDGGRVLRALLATRMPYARATRIAANVGQAMALLFGLVGLLSQNFLLVFIALFVWLGAEGEASMAQIKSSLGGFPVSQAMITEFQTLRSSDPLSNAVEHVLASFQQDFPVVEDGRLLGILTYAGMVKALAEEGSATPAGSVMETTFETVAPTDSLESVFQQLQQCNCPAMPVIEDGHLVGLLTPHNVSEFIMVQNAMHQARGAA
ncbi:MAG: site-2 protease family protein [Candidatus Hydrogenedentes bacterium]|nr:site-2 protease family protein [Candidatus Hydrogenedentota bacterium]